MGSRGVSDIPRDTNVLPKLLGYEEYCRPNKNYIAMMNTAEVTDGKPIAV
jgi:hypothetical protein